MKILGIILTVVGFAIIAGKLFGVIHTFPFAGYITIVIGGFLIKKGSEGASSGGGGQGPGA